MKTIKRLSTVVLLAALVVLVAASCKDDKKEKPAGFGMQGTWSTVSSGTGGTTLIFGTLPNLTYSATTGATTENGDYEYNPASDVLILKPSLDGAKTETYTVKWGNDKYTTCTFSGEGKYKNTTFYKK